MLYVVSVVICGFCSQCCFCFDNEWCKLFIDSVMLSQLIYCWEENDSLFLFLCSVSVLICCFCSYLLFLFLFAISVSTVSGTSCP